MLGTFCAETVATTGTGDLTLSGAVAGAVTINSLFSNNSTDAGLPFQYAIRTVDGAVLESGIGHLSTSTNMVRDLQEGSLQNLPVGTKIVTVTPIGRGILPVTPQIYTSANRRLTGSFYAPHATTTGTPTVNLTYYYPFYKHAFNAVDAVWVYQATAGGSAGNVKVGLYAFNPVTGGPGDRITVGASSGTCSAAAAGYIPVAFSASKTIPPGWYYLAAVWDANGVTSKTYRVVSASATSANPGILGIDASDYPITGFTDTTTYASGPPGTPGTLTAVSANAMPVMGLRVV